MVIKINIERKASSMGGYSSPTKAKNSSYGTGRRKSAVARVWLAPGTGKILVNERGFEDYFPIPSLRTQILTPFLITNNINNFDIFCTVKGGGISGQAGAVRLGIARAMLQVDAEYRPVLKNHPLKLLKRDPRKVERKKYGFKKARRRPQFSKR